jgi:hypothetical protein
MTRIVSSEASSGQCARARRATSLSTRGLGRR